MNKTITDLAKYLKCSQQNLYHMRKNHPKKFGLIWMGWVEYLNQKSI